ncbi:BLUF domain-containing protein, partial [Salinarimonas soli]|uniref:BLUF domain-containing protein n=1 Tax=Salinarimonas soli TaxID=1638099 RepID=UPI001661CAAB
IALGPGPTGWDVAQAFRLRYRTAPIVYASAYVPGENRSLRGSLLFPKPYRASQLVEVLRTLLLPAPLVPSAPLGGLTRVTYMSRATSLMQHPSPEIARARLEAEAQQHNKRLGITGALLASPDWFVQTLEGCHAAVMETLGRISRDRRNTDLRVFAIESGGQRLFAGWWMHVATFEEIDPSLAAACIGAFGRPGRGEACTLNEALLASLQAAA